MTIHQAVKPIVARMLHVSDASIQDDTDISALDHVKLQVEIFQILQFCLGSANGWPQTYGELTKRLEEMKKVAEAPRFEIRM